MQYAVFGSTIYGQEQNPAECRTACLPANHGPMPTFSFGLERHAELLASVSGHGACNVPGRCSSEGAAQFSYHCIGFWVAAQRQEPKDGQVHNRLVHDLKDMIGSPAYVSPSCDAGHIGIIKDTCRCSNQGYAGATIITKDAPLSQLTHTHKWKIRMPHLLADL